MTAIDTLLSAALLAFALGWWLRRLPRRPLVLAVLAFAALGLGVAGVLDDRWQDGVGALVAAGALVVLGVNRLRGAPSRRGVPYLSGAGFGLAAAAAVAAILAFPVSPLPRPSGPDPVGVRTFEVTDASRRGLFDVAPNAPRRLLVRVWYPAGDVRGRTPAPYFSARETRATAETMGAFFGFPPFFTYVRHVRTNAYPDAPLRPGAARLPVVFYSHGYTSFLSQNTVLMEDLASHGYVVVSVQHPYDSAATVFPNGDVAPPDPGLFQMAEALKRGDPAARAERAAQAQAIAGRTLDDRLAGYLTLRERGLATGDRLARSGPIWTADRIFVHDRLQAGAVPPAIREIAAASDLARVGEMGMSFGGAITGAVCMVDRRCAAGVNLDGGDFPFQTFGVDVPVPFLMFHSDLAQIGAQLGARAEGPPHSFNEFSYEGFATAGSRADITRVQLASARHLGLSDFSLFMRRPLRDPLLGSTPAEVMIGAQNDFVRGFFDHHLRGAPNAFPAKELTAYHDWVTPLDVGPVRRWWLAKSEAERAALTARVARARAGRPAAAPAP